jgi:hypothetical protein
VCPLSRARCLGPYNGLVPLYECGPLPDRTDRGPAATPAEPILMRQIRGLVQALGVIVAGGRAVTAPTLPAVTFPAAASESSLDPRLRRWFVGAVIALSAAVLLSATGDLLARRRALAHQKRCAEIDYRRCGFNPPYTIYEQQRGVPPPKTLPRQAG